MATAKRAKRVEAGPGGVFEHVNITHKSGAVALALALMFSTWGPPLRAAGSVIAGSATEAPADDSALWSAICPIVYPVDQSASARGVHFLFYGNGFFINNGGYLLTVAHVLTQLHGGQPYVLLRTRAGAPQVVRAVVVALDRDHDVAVLRVTPNPFDGKYEVSFLPLAYPRQQRGAAVLAAARRPSKPKEAYTNDAFIEERSPGELYDFEFSQLEKNRGDTELFLFNHPVQFGQSGAPVVSADSRQAATPEVVGLVEGQWLRSSLVPLTTAVTQGDPGVGAAIPIHYAIALLEQRNIFWQTVSGPAERKDNDIVAAQAKDFRPPAPLSLVPAPFPWQSLFGGEVIVDALIDAQGRVTEIKVVRGQPPFLEKVFSAVRTWTFFPALAGGHAVPARIGIVFDFSQSPPAQTRPAQPQPSQAKSPDTKSSGPRSSAFEPSSQHEELLPAAADRGALPFVTVEPQSSSAAGAEGSVILYALVSPEGQLTSVQVLSDLDSLTTTAVSALQQWRFTPGRRNAAATNSAAVAVFTRRHSPRATSSRGYSDQSSHAQTP